MLREQWLWDLRLVRVPARSAACNGLALAAAGVALSRIVGIGPALLFTAAAEGCRSPRSGGLVSVSEVCG